MTTLRAARMGISGGRAIVVAVFLVAGLYILYVTTTPMNMNKAADEDMKTVSVNKAYEDSSSYAELMDIRLNWIYPPGPGYNKKEDGSQHGQAKFVDHLLKQRENGFFVECGALDGRYLSNTNFFETQRKWTGLLVEPQPLNFEGLVRSRRKAYVTNACMSPTKKAGLFAWKLVGSQAGLLETHIYKAAGQTPDVQKQCFPFGAMMAALNVTRVDYFSLDIEGGEVPVLKTINWNDVYIDVIGIEYRCVFVFIWWFLFFFLFFTVTLCILRIYEECAPL